MTRTAQIISTARYVAERNLSNDELSALCRFRNPRRHRTGQDQARRPGGDVRLGCGLHPGCSRAQDDLLMLATSDLLRRKRISVDEPLGLA